MTDVRCVVFDVDDTLYLERDYVRSGFSAVAEWVARELGTDDFFGRAWHLFETGVRGTIFNDALAFLGRPVSPHVIEQMINVYRRHQPRIALLDDARRMLTSLHGVVPLAAITDGPLASQKAKIAMLDLERWLDPILYTEELGAAFRKPSALPFKELEARTGLQGSALSYVADNPLKDFTGPKELGWRTVRVRRPAGLHARYITSMHIDHEVADLDGLALMLGLA